MIRPRLRTRTLIIGRSGLDRHRVGTWTVLADPRQLARAEEYANVRPSGGSEVRAPPAALLGPGGIVVAATC
jgi:hypothetical protein